MEIRETEIYIRQDQRISVIKPRYLKRECPVIPRRGLRQQQRENQISRELNKSDEQ